MSAQQTSYSLELSAPNQPGHVCDSHARRVRAFRNDNVAAMPFGLAVCKSSNTDDRGFDVPSTARQFLGVTTWGQSQEGGYPVGTANDGIAPTEMNGILEQGEVLVTTTATVTPDSPVRVILSGGDAGKFCTIADSGGHTTALLANAKFVNRATGASVVKLSLNSPAPLLLVAD